MISWAALGWADPLGFLASGPGLLMVLPIAIKRDDCEFGVKELTDSGKKQDSSKMALVLTSLTDPNGAFEWSKKDLKNLRCIKKSHALYLGKVECAQDIGKAIKLVQEVNPHSKLDLVWMRAHGTQESLKLGNPLSSIYSPKYLQQELCSGELLTDEEAAQMANIRTFSKRPSGSTLFLDSCETGKITQDEIGLAEQIAKCTPHISVVASRNIARSGLIDVKEKKRKLKCSFMKPGLADNLEQAWSDHSFKPLRDWWNGENPTRVLKATRSFRQLKGIPRVVIL